MLAGLYAKLAALALLVVALLGLWLWGHHRGAHGVQVKWDADRVAQATALAVAQAKSAQITTQVITKYVDRVQVVHDRAATIVKRVHVYVAAKADAACTVPTGFVRVHDAAVQGVELPAAAATIDDAASPVALSTVAATVADNYGTCRATAEQLKALQDWTKQQAGVHR